jgi:1-acyl-sn-glycerol-3-phosphate acyltransferase
MLRTISAVALLAIFIVFAIPLQWISLKLGLPSQRWIPLAFHKFSARMMGVRVQVRGLPAAERPLLLVSNHSSWLDIVVLSSVLPVVFIAKSEIARWPLFGLFAKLQRSVFVDRAKRQETRNVNRTIAARLANGDPVVLFGEGTAGDGNLVRPFRSALLGALRDALGEQGRGSVQPVSVAYTRLQGIPMGRQHRPVAARYGKMNLPAHIKRVLREGAIDVAVTFGVPVKVGSNADRKLLARSTEAAVRHMTVAALAGREMAPKKPIPSAHSTGVSLPAERR